jgi:hypothetical protein
MRQGLLHVIREVLPFVCYGHSGTVPHQDEPNKAFAEGFHSSLVAKAASSQKPGPSFSNESHQHLTRWQHGGRELSSLEVKKAPSTQNNYVQQHAGAKLATEMAVHVFVLPVLATH